MANAFLNGREYQRLIDPDVDLSWQSQRLRLASWLAPLEIYLFSRLQKCQVIDHWADVVYWTSGFASKARRNNAHQSDVRQSK